MKEHHDCRTDTGDGSAITLNLDIVGDTMKSFYCPTAKSVKANQRARFVRRLVASS
jgi:hypothetical protein